MMYDETAGHVGLGSVPGYDLQPGHRYTFELGWYCISLEPTERTIPLAALSFTAPVLSLRSGLPRARRDTP